MLKISEMRLNGGKWNENSRYCISETQTPWFSWSLTSDEISAVQRSFRIKIIKENECIYDSQFIDSSSQEFKCPEELPKEEWLTVNLEVIDGDNCKSAKFSKRLIISGLEESRMKWISQSMGSEQKAISFSKEFSVNRKLKKAVLYACGIGYHKVEINGKTAEKTKLDPAFSDYTKTCYYVMLSDVSELLHWGGNLLQITLGQGWRNNKGIYYDAKSIGREIAFMGELALAAYIKLEYQDGGIDYYSTDESWSVLSSKIIFTHLFDGEVFDNNQKNVSIEKARFTNAPGGKFRLMTVEPIVEKEILKPISIYKLKKKYFILDFGENIAGVCRVKLPALKNGDKVILTHAEELRQNGELFTDILRGAKAQDVYIASGEEQNNTIWQPEFVYHGFRYAAVEGLDFIDENTVTAVNLRSDIENTGSFVCGNGILNQIHKTIVNTEKSNMHSILTDCPQRDERMGWMNDATVRFNELPYNFDIGRILPKVIRDLLDCQSADGAITCTAPFVYGNRPADPVCSSFLVAGLETLKFSGNTEVLKNAFAGFEAWQKCLTEHTDSGVVNYSYYGDWAGPIFACENGENDIDAVISKNVPGEFISTGFYYYNAKLLKEFSLVLGYNEKADFYDNQMNTIKRVILDKWWNDEKAQMVNGSQACQSFALWLGIIPENKKQQAADIIHNDLVKNNYRISTGNLCTRYLLDALSENGYIDDAYRIMTNEEYPSLGYMLQNAATTVWERFEQKENRAMNSHNHPMYGSVGYWFYAYLAGIKVTAAGCSRVHIKPFFPQKLLYVNCTVDTIKGKLSVRWNKQYGKLTLFVNVPVGMQADVEFNGKIETVQSGFHRFSKDIETSDRQYFDIAKKYNK